MSAIFDTPEGVLLYTLTVVAVIVAVWAVWQVLNLPK